MKNSDVREEQLLTSLNALSPWTEQQDFSESEWGRYLTVARMVQKTDSATVESTLNKFLARAAKESFAGSETESKPFILLRAVFDLPEAAPVERRRSFKGWTNWPKPNADGQVSLAWPVSWRTGKPHLVAPYEGSLGLPYAADQEYRYMLDNFPYRNLGEPGK